MIEFQEVAMQHGPRAVLRGATFTFEKDRVYVLRGPSGAGKSTVLNLASGYLHPTSGRVRTTGQVEYLMQDELLFSELTIEQNLAVRRTAVDDGDAATAAADSTAALQRLGLAGREQTRVADLSGGERRRVELAGTLIRNPAVLLLDEPVANLDQTTAADVYAAVWSVKDGRTVVIVTHETNLSVMPGPVTALTLNDGRIVER